MKKNILITGGHGYVGARVAQYLATSSNYNLVLGSRHRTSHAEWIEGAVTCKEIDWSSRPCLGEICQGVDTIIHLAAMNEIDAAHDPAGALVVNGVSTVHLLESAREQGVRRFIYMSTAHVYGSPLSGVIDERICPRPVHPYATSHRAAEDVVLASHSNGAISGVVLRLSNSFGMPAHTRVDRWTLLVNDLCKQAVVTGRLELRSSGTQRRDFIALNDVGSAVKHMVELPENDLGDGLFNLGGDWAPSIYEMTCLVAERCDQVLGFKPDIIRPRATGTEQEYHLVYKVDKLAKTGFILSRDVSTEIDNTLLFCSKLFGQ